MDYRTASLRLVLAAIFLAPHAARAQRGGIPVDGLELWVKADGPMKVANNQMDFQAASALYTRGLGLIKSALGKR